MIHSIAVWRIMERTSRKIIITKYNKKIISVVYINGKAYDIDVHLPGEPLLNSIHAAKVKNIAANIDAAFLEICLQKDGKGKNTKCFYSLKDNKSHLYLDNISHEKLKEGDDVLVQIIKESVKAKVPIATSHISLSGIYIVVSVGRGRINFSSKIKDNEWKQSTAELLSNYLEDGMDLLLRTNAYTADTELIINEVKKYKAKLNALLEKAAYRNVPSLLYSSDKSYINLVKKYLNSELIEILTDLEPVYNEIRQFVEIQNSTCLTRIRFYNDLLLPLAKLYSIETLISEALSRKVWLKSGAYIVIEPTESLTAIDVNTGKRSNKENAQESVRQTNIEAAVEIARQLRLRNISGIIVVDFIDMLSENDKKELFEVINGELKKDPLKAAAVDITALNLIEITRQKIRKPLHEQFMLDI